MLAAMVDWTLKVKVYRCTHSVSMLAAMVDWTFNVMYSVSMLAALVD